MLEMDTTSQVDVVILNSGVITIDTSRSFEVNLTAPGLPQSSGTAPEAEGLVGSPGYLPRVKHAR